jgi:hypothetical protein
VAESILEETSPCSLSLTECEAILYMSEGRGGRSQHHGAGTQDIYHHHDDDDYEGGSSPGIAFDRRKVIPVSNAVFLFSVWLEAPGVISSRLHACLRLSGQ